MERLVIIDHSNHTLFIEDVTEEMLAPYNGSEQGYIDDNYTFGDGGYSWDYITDAEYVDALGDVHDLDIDLWLDDYECFI